MNNQTVLMIVEHLLHTGYVDAAKEILKKVNEDNAKAGRTKPSI